MHVAINEKGLLSKVILRLEHKWERQLWVGQFWEFLLFPDVAVMHPVALQFLGAHLSPRTGQAASHGATSSLVGTCWVRQVFPAWSGGEEHPRDEQHWRPTGNRPPAPSLNGAVGHWGVVAISDSQATLSLPCLGSPGALQLGCPPLTKGFGMWVGSMDSACLTWVSIYFTSHLCVLNLLRYCTGAYIRDRYAVI